MRKKNFLSFHSLSLSLCMCVCVYVLPCSRLIFVVAFSLVVNNKPRSELKLMLLNYLIAVVLVRLGVFSFYLSLSDSHLVFFCSGHSFVHLPVFFTFWNTSFGDARDVFPFTCGCIERKTESVYTYRLRRFHFISSVNTLFAVVFSLIRVWLLVVVIISSRKVVLLPEKNIEIKERTKMRSRTHTHTHRRLGCIFKCNDEKPHERWL